MSKYKVGDRVRVRGGMCDWRAGQLIQWRANHIDTPFQVLTKPGHTDWWPECELVEGGDE